VCTQPEFVKKSYLKDLVYDKWQSILTSIESSTISTGVEDDSATNNSLEIGYKLFPLIDSISMTLLGKNGVAYLKKLGYSDAEASLTYKSLRNGLLHGASPRKLFYKDGEVEWSIFSSSGSGGFTPHNPGDEYSEADKGIEYFMFPDGSHYLWITYDRLVEHIKHDLRERKSNDSRDEIELVVGEKIDENLRTAPLRNP